tara:strand:+ start:9819 stop:10160 length:342 start_codon:yes stop_codon:yes gene_type:complete
LAGSKLSDEGPLYAVLVDLVRVRGQETSTGQMGISHEYVFDKVPSKCPACANKKFRGYEILGAYHKPLVWECCKCEMRYPRFKLKKMEELLDKVKDLWTNPNDWGYEPREDFN